MTERRTIKVKLLGMYRECELLRAYRSKATGELGYVDVRVIGGRVPQGHTDTYRYVPVSGVRKADRAIAAAALPARTPR